MAWKQNPKTGQWGNVPDPPLARLAVDPGEFKSMATLNVVGRPPCKLGEDFVLYEELNGTVKGFVPIPEHARGSIGTGYLAIPDSADFPNDGDLKGLWNWFTEHTPDRESILLIGKMPDGSFVYMCPNQIGEPSHVDWVDDNAMIELIQAGAEPMGTIHVHPGNSAAQSGTDLRDISDPTRGGIHLIVARDGSYTITVSTGSFFRTWDLTWNKNADAASIRVLRSGNKPFEDLLQVPRRQEIVIVGGRDSSYVGFNRTHYGYPSYEDWDEEYAAGSRSVVKDKRRWAKEERKEARRRQKTEEPQFGIFGAGFGTVDIDRLMKRYYRDTRDPLILLQNAVGGLLTIHEAGDGPGLDEVARLPIITVKSALSDMTEIEYDGNRVVYLDISEAPLIGGLVKGIGKQWVRQIPQNPKG